MVRLRREIDGIRVDRAVPPPAYALDPLVRADVLPSLDACLSELPGRRVLLAGHPDPARIHAIAEAGKLLTVADLDARAAREIHAGLPPALAGRVTLVDKPYGDAAFGPSSFDAIVLLDSLHRYREPDWVLHKLYRELKFDAPLIARLWVQGEGADALAGEREGSAVAGERWRERETIRRLLGALEGSARGPVAWALLTARGRDAVERGALLPAEPRAGALAQTMAAVKSKLVVERMLVGHTLRARAGNLAWGSRAGMGRILRGLQRRVPELADHADATDTAPRVVGLVARKVLGRGRAGALR